MELKIYCYLLCYYYNYHYHRLFISGNSGNRKHYRKTYCSQFFLTSAMWRHKDRQIYIGNLPHPLSILLPSSRRYRMMAGKGFLRNVGIPVYLTGRTTPCPINQISLQSRP